MPNKFNSINIFLVLVALIALTVLVAGAQAQNRQFYTTHNIWYDSPDKIFSINYHKGKILPAGTRVEIIRVEKGESVTFQIAGTNQKFTLIYQDKFHGPITFSKFMDRLFTEKSFEELTQGLTQQEIDAIKAGKLVPGMSKKAVVIALGFPPEHKTASLNSNTWVYWFSRFKKTSVNFDANGQTILKGKAAAQSAKTNIAEIQTDQAKDTTPPVIVITEPAVTRGMRMAAKTIMIKGNAKDNSGVFEVQINGVDAHLGANGDFWAEVPLAVGNNKIVVRAKDTKSNAADQTFIILREGEAAPPLVAAATKQPVSISAGKYHALIIGVQDYNDNSINDLDEPVRDADRLKNILSVQYTFEPQNVTVLKNPSHDEIMSQFEDLSNKITKNDNVLIFYAGHGYWDDKFQQGYWLPADAEKERRTKWISNSTIVDYIRGIQSNHTLLVTDACFSGGIFKTRAAFTDTPPAIQELYKMPSRKAMTSGTLKEVPDKSVFVEYLTKRLSENSEKYITAEQLFVSFRTAVINNSPINQIPQYGEIRQSGDEGGDFIFIKK